MDEYRKHAHFLHIVLCAIVLYAKTAIGGECGPGLKELLEQNQQAMVLHQQVLLHQQPVLLDAPFLRGARKAFLYSSMPFGQKGDAMRMILNDPAISNINASTLKKASKQFPILKSPAADDLAAFKFYEPDPSSLELRAQQLLTLQDGEVVRLVTKDGNQITGRILASESPESSQKQISVWTDLNLENKSSFPNGYEIQIRWDEIATVGRDPQLHANAVKKLPMQDDGPYRSLHVAVDENYPKNTLNLGRKHNLIDEAQGGIIFSVNNRDAYFYQYGRGVSTVDFKTGQTKANVSLGKKEDLLEVFPSGWALVKTESSPRPYTHAFETYAHSWGSEKKIIKNTRYWHSWDLWAYDLNTGKRKHLERVPFEYGAKEVSDYSAFNFSEAHKRWKKKYGDQTPKDWPGVQSFRNEDNTYSIFSNNKNIEILPQDDGVKIIKKNGQEIRRLNGQFLCFSAGVAPNFSGPAVYKPTGGTNYVGHGNYQSGSQLS